MTVTNLAYLHSIQLPGGQLIKELTDVTPAANTHLLVGFAAGDVAPTFLGGTGARPDIRFRTPQVKEILDLTGIPGVDLSAGNVDLYYRWAEDLGDRELIAASEHFQMRCARCFLYWERITARQGDGPNPTPAEIECRLVPTSTDGSTNPVTLTGDQAIPSGEAADEYFTLGPVTINALLKGVQEYTLELQPEIEEVAGDGEPFLTHCGVRRVTPALTAQIPDLEPWASFPSTGAALTSLVAYLRKCKADEAIPVAAGTAQHISFTGSDGLVAFDRVAGGANDPANLALRANLRNANASLAYPLAINTATAIT